MPDNINNFPGPPQNSQSTANSVGKTVNNGVQRHVEEKTQFNSEENLANDEIHYSLFTKRTIIFVLAGLVIIFILRIAGDLPPFIWAIITAYILNRPLAGLVKRTGWPRWAWATIFYMVFFGIVALILAWVIPNISREAKQLTQDAPIIKAQIDDYLNNNDTVNIVGFNLSTDTVSSAINSTIDTISTQAKSLAPKALTITFRLLIDILLYLVVTFYVLLAGSEVIFHGVDSLPLKYRGEMRGLVLRIDRVLTAYIRGQFILIGIMTTASFIILTVLGVNYAFVLAIMTGILELVPYVGPYLAMTIAGGIAYFQPHNNFNLTSLVLAIVVVAAYFIVRQIEDYVVVPNVIGKIVELPGVLVIFAILAGATILGPIGLLLAVPITATIKIIVGYLFYKLVDADRQKIDSRQMNSIAQIIQILKDKPNSRVLLEVGDHPEYLSDPQNLQALKHLEQEEQIDIAVNTGDEKIASQLRDNGIPVVTVAQEHFLNSHKNK